MNEQADVRERQPGVFSHAVVRTVCLAVRQRARDTTRHVSPVTVRVDHVRAAVHGKLVRLLKRAVPHVHAGVPAPDHLPDAGDARFVKRTQTEPGALNNLRRLGVHQRTRRHSIAFIGVHRASPGAHDGTRRHPLHRAAGREPVHGGVQPGRKHADDHLPNPRDSRERGGVAGDDPHARLKRRSRRRYEIEIRVGRGRCDPRDGVHARREHRLEQHAAGVVLDVDREPSQERGNVR